MLSSDPFSCLIVRNTRAKGESWFFHMSCDGQFTAKMYPPGSRIFGRNGTIPCNDAYFIPSRNFHGKGFGLVASLRRKKKNNVSKVGEICHDFNLVLVQGIHFDGHDDLILRYHAWSGLKPFHQFINAEATTSLDQSITTSFQLDMESKLSDIEVIYLNSVLCKRQGPLAGMNLVCDNAWKIENHGLECSLKSCDTWFIKHRAGQRYHPFKLKNSEVRDDCKTFRKAKKKKRNKPPKLLLRSKKRSALYVMKMTKPSHVLNKMYSIFHSFSECKKFVHFALITQGQLGRLKIISNKVKKAFSPRLYQYFLEKFVSENKSILVQQIRISAKDQESNSFVVCACKDSDKLSDDIKKCRIDGAQNECYKVYLDKNVEDIERNEGIVIFRGYQWPFKNVLNQNAHKLIEQTFCGSGLIRSKVAHQGTFEFIGKRNSNQASGSLSCRPGNSSNHQYYRASMNNALIPHARSIANHLQKEAIYANFTSGDSLMTAYLQEFGECNEKMICSETIITLRHYANTIHKDCSYVNHSETKHVKQFLSKDKRWENYFKRYEELYPGDPLPKSTTCCWSPKTHIEGYDLLQFFCFMEASFCFDISSSESEILESLGATFQSSLCSHCTSVPVWVDEYGNIIVTATHDLEDFYNFAWGSNGNRCVRRRFYDENGGAAVPRLTPQEFLNWLHGMPPDVYAQAQQLGLVNN